MCIMQIPGAFGSHKRALDLLGLELKMVMNFYVDAGIHTWVLLMKLLFCPPNKYFKARFLMLPPMEGILEFSFWQITKLRFIMLTLGSVSKCGERMEPGFEPTNTDV